MSSLALPLPPSVFHGRQGDAYLCTVARCHSFAARTGSLIRRASPPQSELSRAANPANRAQISGRDAAATQRNLPGFHRCSVISFDNRGSFRPAHSSGDMAPEKSSWPISIPSRAKPSFRKTARQQRRIGFAATQSIINKCGDRTRGPVRFTKDMILARIKRRYPKSEARAGRRFHGAHCFKVALLQNEGPRRRVAML